MTIVYQSAAGSFRLPTSRFGRTRSGQQTLPWDPNATRRQPWRVDVQRPKRRIRRASGVCGPRRCREHVVGTARPSGRRRARRSACEVSWFLPFRDAFHQRGRTMRTSIGWRLVSESVHNGSAPVPERTPLLRWLALSGLAVIIALSLAVSPSRAVAGGAKSTLGTPAGDETPQPPEASPAGGANSRYLPRLIGLARFRQHAHSKGTLRPGLGTEDCPLCDPLGVFDSTHFFRPTKIDNDWLPLIPGTQMVLQGVANRGGGLLPHLVIFTVTDLIKRLN